MSGFEKQGEEEKRKRREGEREGRRREERKRREGRRREEEGKRVRTEHIYQLLIIKSRIRRPGVGVLRGGEEC